MRLQTAEGQALRRSKALVLGPRAVARWIAEELEREGIETFLQEELRPGNPQIDLPSLGDPDAQPKLRQALGAFLDFAGRPSGPYSHVLHPGTSPWADRPELPLLAQELGLNVISAPSRVLSLFANKLNLIGEAERLGIPNLAISLDPIYSQREVEALLARLGQPSPAGAAKQRFPLVLKSVRGGGRQGICVLQQPEDLEKAFPLWIEQVRRNAGEAIFFAERYLEGARHVVVPFARTIQGKIEILPFVDASLQSRYRKIVEFCPATGVDPAIEQAIREHVSKFAAHSGFVGVGSLEFLADASRVFMIDGAARLNTAFRLWEKVSGRAAVSLQLAAAEGRPFPEAEPEREWKSAAALRLYAEDPVLQLPQPGFVKELSDRREWKFPGAAAELAMGIAQGEEVPLDSEGLLGVLLVGARERKQTLTIARGVLDELWIAGGLQTNERFLSELLAHPWVKEGMFHAAFLDEEFIPEVRPKADLPALFASVCAYAEGAKSQSHRWTAGDQWVKPDASRAKWAAAPVLTNPGGEIRGVSGTLELEDGRRVKVCAYPLTAAPSRWQVRIGSWVLGVRKVAPPAKGEAPARKSLKLFSLVPGRVHSVLFREGASAPPHEPVLIVESLSRLVPHSLPIGVRIVRWKVGPEQKVALGQELAELAQSDT